MVPRGLTWFMLIPAVAAACGGDQPATDEAGEAAGTPPPPAAAPAPPPGDVDQAMASRGEGLFQTKGCIGCHTIGGGRLTGPDLQGVTDRRGQPWLIAMIVNPDSMLRADPEAKKLLAEYMTPMMNMGVTREDALALYEYLRSKQ